MSLQVYWFYLHQKIHAYLPVPTLDLSMPFPYFFFEPFPRTVLKGSKLLQHVRKGSKLSFFALCFPRIFRLFLLVPLELHLPHTTNIACQQLVKHVNS